MLRHILSKRFSSIPNWVNTELAELTVAELDAIAVRSLDAARLEDLFPPKR